MEVLDPCFGKDGQARRQVIERCGSVLVLALESDLHADAVVYQLSNLGVPVVRIDPTVDRYLPKCVRISFNGSPKAEYEFADGAHICLGEVAGVLCRFAVDALIPSESAPLSQFSKSEEIAAFLAPLRAITTGRWINDPWCEARADCRILQAYEAQMAGLNVPPFVVSTRYSDLLEFAAAQRDGCVIKPISDVALARVSGEFIEPGCLSTDQFCAPYAAVFEPLHTESVQQLDSTPSLVQAHVRKKLDVRATVIDDKVFSAAMPVAEDAPIDFRRVTDIQVTPFDLPEKTQRSLVALVSALNLRFASCDLVVDSDGAAHFLEANVSGNWLWTEIGGDLPISRAIAEALINPVLRTSPRVFNIADPVR